MRRATLLFLSATCLATPTFADAPPAQYTLKDRSSPTGSLIPRRIAWANFPLNLKYAELSPEQKAMVEGEYESIPKGDEPPYPAEGMKSIVLAASKAQQRFLVAGDLELVVTVDSEGNAVEAAAYKSPSPEMTKFVASVMMVTKYKPAVCSGKPCAMQFPFRIHFALDN